MQVMDETYQELADNNAVKKITIYPSRGNISDRKGLLLVENIPVYELEVIPSKVKNIDTLKFCRLLGIAPNDFTDIMQKAKQYSRHKASVFLSNITPDQYASIQEYLYQFSGFRAQVRTMRNYPYHSAAHVLGYLGEVSQQELDTSQYYDMGDFVGVSGIEKNYENELRGIKGERYVVVDVLNREKKPFKNGQLDRDVEIGKDLQLTLDIVLQEYGEALMQNKRGAIVAIEPSSGEILALVSSPTYDPNLLTGRERGGHFRDLERHPHKPLFNRPLQAKYPPGSTLKPLVGLIALDEGVITPNTGFPCGGGYRVGNKWLRCSHSHYSARNIQQAIKESCNPYFWQTFRNIIENPRYNSPSEALDNWGLYLNNFGIGKSIKVDLPNAIVGNVPSSAYYTKLYGGKRRWGATTIISLGIGQGELTVTPLELANYVSIIANKGSYFYPHVVKNHKKLLGDKSIYAVRNMVPSKVENIWSVIEGMAMVIDYNWTGIYNKDLGICGKTGTAQNPGGKDHSLFIGFAPRQDPKIAIAVVVENSGFGAEFAAPIASLMMEKYINDSIPKERKWTETRMKNIDLINPKVQQFPLRRSNDTLLTEEENQEIID